MKNNNWFGLFVMTMVVALMLGLASGVMAEGGKNRNASIVFDSDGNVIAIPENLKDCTLVEIPASEQSGVSVYFCDDED